ncbi:hypothetical protein NLU13_3886 [Sarocladium strictum]|uniref:N-acetylglucosamine-induced protein 1 n=1 Tax=Sarocladium strictum TaxID=5046 RepID=A0AA39GIH9_SARSR|nr:hypothetical protein NLU13_3886 [Sarocladium strictum]
MTTSSTPQASQNQHQPTSTSSISSSQTPYWNLNIPTDLHTPSCPPYLLNLSEKDINHLHLPDSSYTRLTFSQIRTLISSNRLQDFTRLPSDLRKYRKFVYDLTQRYGSVERYMLEERLGWDAEELGGNADGERKKPFEERSDYRILMNDWPYGVEKGIEHVVVWTKFSLGGEEEGEDSGRDAIEEFMEQVFYSHLPRENVVWFRNWGALKSVHAVEHFHIMLLNPDSSFLNSIVETPTPLRPNSEASRS